MPATNAKIALALFAITVATQAANNHTAYPSILPSPTRPASRSGGNDSCFPGLGKEHHQVVKDSVEFWPYQVYKSSPFNPPEFEITNDGEPLSPGLLLITPSDGSAVNATKDTAPMIMTDTGQLVWHGPAINSDNLRVVSYEGKPSLTYWSGISSSGANVGHGYGSVTFLDENYKEILNVCPRLGLLTPDNVIYTCQGDFHESFVTDRNTLLVTAYNVTQTDLSPIGGPSDGWVLDCLFFELDPKTSDVLFRWSALEHIPVTETKLNLTGRGGFNQSKPFDWFHINSVVNIGDKFLMSSRHLWTVYLITAKGEVEWTLQGDTGGDFGLIPANGHFSWQHFARPHNVTETSITISIFNNYNALGIDNGTHPSNSLVFHLTLPPNKSSPPVLIDYLSDPNDAIYSNSQGSSSPLPNGDFLIGYGEIPVIEEFGLGGPQGVVRWTARFGFDNLVQSYRTYKAEWHGFPTTCPDLAVEEDGSGCRRGYVSWNGATDVKDWVIYEGRTRDRLALVSRIGYKGFETQFTVGQPCTQVAAVVHGRISARSSVVCTI